MVRINLLPAKLTKKKIAGKQQLLLFVAVLLLGIVGNIVVAQGRAAALESRQRKLANTREEISRLDKVIGEVSQYKQAKKDLEAKLAILDKLKQGRTGPVRMLDSLASITPKRLWLRKMDEKGGAITFDGTAATIDDVSAFMKALEDSQYFGKVELKKTAAKVEKATKLVDFTVTTAANYTPLVSGAVAASGAAAPAAGAR
jgi:type IV pilus assembly protein PilN